MNIDELIPAYGEHKSEFDALKKVVDAENKEIKKYLVESGEDKKEVGGWVAKRTIQKRESLNESKLLAILSENPSVTITAESLGIIKVQRYIDFDALEKAIYNGQLSPEMVIRFDSAKEIKEVETLRVTKAKSK